MRTIRIIVVFKIMQKRGGGQLNTFSYCLFSFRNEKLSQVHGNLKQIKFTLKYLSDSEVLWT